MQTHPAQKTDDGIKITDPYSGQERTYHRIIGAVAYGDPSGIDPELSNPALVVAGELIDERLRLIREFQGESQTPFDELKAEMIRLKDEYLVSVYFVAQDKLLFRDLVETDGLTYYKHDIGKKGLRDQPLYKEKEPEKVWPSFRNHRTMAALAKLPDRLLDELSAAVILADRLARDGVLLWEPLTMKRLGRIMKEPLEDRRKNPVYLAYVYAVWLLWQNAQANKLDVNPDETRRFSWKDYHKQNR